MSKIYFSQADSRWGSKMYSITNNKSQTIKSSGCGPTAAAMVVSSLTGNVIYPDEMAEYYVKNGYRTTNNGTYWSAFSATAKKYNIEFKQSNDINIAIDCVNKNGIVIVNAKGGSAGLFSTNGHYIVLVGLANNEFTIYDSYLYNGKYSTNNRKNKARVEGDNVYSSIENVKAEANQYFCFYDDKDEIITKAKYVRVNTSLNIRSGPGLQNTVIGGLKNNTLVTVYEEKNGFCRIGEGKWVSNDYLKDSPEYKQIARIMTVTAKIGLNVRERATTNSKVVTAYKKGTKVTVYEINNGWARGIKGWMYAKYLK